MGQSEQGISFSRLHLLAFFLSFTFLSLDAQNKPESEVFHFLNPFLNVDAGYAIRSTRQSNYQDESIQYMRDDFKLLTVNLNGGMLDQSLLSFNYQRTFPKGEFQQELLGTEVHKVEGLERYRFGVILDALARYLFPDDLLARMVLSLRFRYARELSQTKAVVNQRFIYLPPNSITDYDARTAQNALVLPNGSSYYFKTRYHYFETTVRIPIMPAHYEKTFGGIRLGYAEWDYSRPFSTSVVRIDGLPVVYDANPIVKALVFVFEPLDEGSPGLRFDGTLALGVKDVITSSLDWKQVREFKQANTEVQFSTSRFELNLWYNFYAKPMKAKGVFATLGASIHGYNFDILHVRNPGEDDSRLLRRVENSDIFTRLWITIAMRF